MNCENYHMTRLTTLSATILFVLFSFGLKAQTYYQVTNFSGTQTYGGVGVTVTSTGSVSTGGGQCYFTPTPYWAGQSGAGQYTFNFNQPVGTILLNLEGLNSGEYVQVYINGILYCIQPCNVVCSFVIPCNGGGNLGFVNNCNYYGPNTLYGGGQLIFPAGNITSFEVWCNGTLAGTDFWLQFSPTVNNNNSCPSCFYVTSNSPVCTGGTLLLHASDPNATSYSWTGPNGFASNLQDPSIPNVTLAASGIYTVIATTPNGFDTGTVTVVINPTPVITASSTNPTTCGGANGTITLAGLTSGTGYTITYTDPGGTTHNVNQTANVSGDVMLSGLVQGIYTNIYVTVTATGCVSNIVGPITLVDPTPPSALVVTSNSPVCLGQTLNFTANSGGADQYHWTGPSAFNSNIQNPSIPNIQYVNAGIYTVYASNSITQCTSNTVTTTVVVQPPATANFSFTTALGCVQDTVMFVDNSTNAATYNWDFGDGSNDFSQNPVHYYTSQGVFNVTETVTSALGCSSAVTQPVTLIHPTQAVNMPVPDTACAGQPINFVGINSIGSGLYYSWDFGDGSLATTTGNPSHIFSTPGTYNTALTVTNYMGCANTAYKNVYIGGVNARTAFHDTTVCLVDSMALNAFVTSPTSDLFTGYKYSWTPVSGIGFDSSLTAQFFTVGNYTYTFTATSIPFGCVGTDTMHINSYPPLTLTNVTASQTIPIGSSIQLNANGADYYFWTPDNGTLNNPNINYPVATPTDPTMYVVHGMSIYGCRDSAVVNIDIDYTLHELIPSAFTPNGDGRNDVFRVLNARYQKLLDFRVYNRWGQLIYQTTDIDKGWDGTFNGVPQDMGVYNYVIILAKPDGTDKTYSGTVTLIR